MGLNVETDTRTDWTFQGSFYTPGIEEPDEGIGCVTQPMPPGSWIADGNNPGGGSQDFCWLVFNKHYATGGSPRLRWLHRNAAMKEKT